MSEARFSMSKLFNWKSAQDAAQTVLGAVAALRSNVADLRSEKADLQAKVDELQRKPVSSADAKQFMFDVIDHAAEEFAKSPEWRNVFEDIAFPLPSHAVPMSRTEQRKGAPLSLAVIDAALSGGAVELTGAIGAAAYGLFNVVAESRAREYFFFGELIKAKIERHFDELYPSYRATENPTDSIRERRATVAVWLQRISVIEAEIEKAEEGIRALGHRA